MKSNSLLPSVNTLFDDFFSKDIFDWNNRNFSSLGSTLPSANLKENDEQMEIELVAPGMKKEDFKIEIENNLLSISCEKKEEKTEEDKKNKYTRKEFNYESFCRSFYLPSNVRKDEISATYKDGLLHVTILKNNDESGNGSKIITVK